MIRLIGLSLLLALATPRTAHACFPDPPPRLVEGPLLGDEQRSKSLPFGAQNIAFIELHASASPSLELASAPGGVTIRGTLQRFSKEAKWALYAPDELLPVGVSLSVRAGDDAFEFRASGIVEGVPRAPTVVRVTRAERRHACGADDYEALLFEGDSAERASDSDPARARFYGLYFGPSGEAVTALREPSAVVRSLRDVDLTALGRAKKDDTFVAVTAFDEAGHESEKSVLLIEPEGGTGCQTGATTPAAGSWLALSFALFGWRRLLRRTR